MQKLKSNPNLAADSDTVVQNLPTLYSFWYLIPKNIFEIPANGRENIILKKIEGANNDDFPKKSNRMLLTKHMLMQGDLKLKIAKIAEEKFLPIIERYFIIKAQRNDSAHARLITKEKSSVSNSEKTHAEFLKDYMKQGLDEYSEII